MPINPLYQFIEPGAADIDDRNKVLNFLQQDAQRTGMPLNYQRELGAAQEQMNVLDQARPRLNMGPAPRAMPPRPRPQVPMQQIRGAQLPMSPMGEAPDLQSPVAPEPKDIQGFGGLASQQEVPMGMPANVGGKIEVPPPASIANQPIEQLPSASVTMERQVPDRFAQTTMAQMGQKAGWDPRALYAAMAQFSGEFGNLYGKATPSSAQPYYEQMMDAEQKAQAAAQKAREAALDRSQREREMEMRYSPKTIGPEAELKMELVRVQTDALKNKLRVDQEMNDPDSERSKALKFGLEKYVQKTMNMPQFKAHPNLTGADVYKWLGSMQFAAGQQNLMTREQLRAIGSAESKAADQRWREQEAKKQRDFQAEQNALNREAAQQRQQTAIEARPAKPGETGAPADQVLIPGYVRTQNVPVRDPELSKARTVVGQVKPMEDDITQLQALIKQYGSFENPYSEAGRRMQSLARAIQLKLKSEAFLQLGVLAGPDLALLETQIPDTGSIKNMGQADAFIKQLEDVKRRLRGGVDEQMRMIGFEREGKTTSQTEQTGPRGRKLWKP